MCIYLALTLFFTLGFCSCHLANPWLGSTDSMAGGVRLGSRSPLTSQYTTMTSRRPPISPGYSTTYGSSYSTGSSSYAPSTYQYRTRTVSRDRFISPPTTGESSYSSSRIRSPSPVSSRYAGTTTRRPLPKGRGPLDANGRKMAISDNLSTLRSNISRGSENRTSKKGPVKPQYHEYGSSNTSHSPTYKDTTMKSPTRRTSSISDLTNGVGNVSLTSSKRFGSNFDIAASSNSSVRKFSRDTATELSETTIGGSSNATITEPSTRKQKQVTHTETISLNQDNSDSRLPNINVNNLSSRSPSLEHSGSPDRDDTDSPPGKRQLGSKRLSESNGKILVCTTTIIDV